MHPLEPSLVMSTLSRDVFTSLPYLQDIITDKESRQHVSLYSQVTPLSSLHFHFQKQLAKTRAFGVQPQTFFSGFRMGITAIRGPRIYI